MKAHWSSGKLVNLFQWTRFKSLFHGTPSPASWLKERITKFIVLFLVIEAWKSVFFQCWASNNYETNFYCAMKILCTDFTMILCIRHRNIDYSYPILYSHIFILSSVINQAVCPVEHASSRFHHTVILLQFGIWWSCEILNSDMSLGCGWMFILPLHICSMTDIL